MVITSMTEKCWIYALPVHCAWERAGCAQQLNRKAESAGGDVAHKVRKATRDVNAARNILYRHVAVAGWVIGSMSRPGASEHVLDDYRAGLPDENAERYPAEGFQSWI